MPPLVLWTIGVVAAASLVKLVQVASKKANEDLRTVRRETAVDRSQIPTLVRDPITGEYRPKR